ncbi:hypothetical protein NDN08_006937 [Rhodosorus marinus]|uniref:magnesium chelatase n=1 Tax=Rhodosorus marinus TaxID=101924 RepID=A0AAV8UJL1_9RHOD|nr:hypothetical protein NDN08_006937 [Rhodosorus marinus]
MDCRPAFVPGCGVLGSSSFAGNGLTRSTNERTRLCGQGHRNVARSSRVVVRSMLQTGLFTDSNPNVRKVSPKKGDERKCMKVVYVVLESQYQSTMTAAAKSINEKSENLSMEVCGYLVEELRNPENFEMFKKDVAEANVFIGSLIFVQEIAEKVAEAVAPHRDSLDACIVFPSMPEVMRLNKLGSFSMSQLGQSKSAIASFMKKKRQQSGSSFEDGMLKLLRTLPKVLKYLPVEKAQDARSFMMSFQYWLGGTPENVENFLLMIADKYVEAVPSSGQAVADPEVFPDVGLWHPLAPKMFESLAEYEKWYEEEHMPKCGLTMNSPTVGLVLQRSHMITRDDCHYVSLVSELEASGARVLPVFAGGLDFSVPVNKFYYHEGTTEANVDVVVSLTGFALVGGPAKQDHPKAIETLKKLDRPYMCCVPLVFQTFEEWRDSDLGLHPVQVALQVSLPEIDGALEPVIFAGRDGPTGRSIPMQNRIETVAKRAMKWANLRRRAVQDKKIAITLFSFPPDKGNIGTAAYLDVFGSVHKVLEGLQREGYNVGELPETAEDLLEEVVHDKEARFNSPNLNIAYKMSVPEYEEHCGYQEDLHENWGAPPGHLNSDGQNLLVFGKEFGNVFVGIQPSFGYEGDPMRLLFSKSASPHHGFAAFYTYLESIWGADACLHFGTHGSLEFMPGKQVGMSGDCYPDQLISSIPNIYYYAANNPSEATIAKRRSYAGTISYLTPPAENAGLYRGLKEMSELVASYQGLKDNELRATAICNSLVEKARQCNFERDVPLPEDDCKGMGQEKMDDLVGKLYKKLIEIESRLLPCGLHTVGKPPTAEEAVATLVNIASLDRPEDGGLKALPRIVAESVGRDIDDVYRSSDMGKFEDVDLLQRITFAARDAVTAIVKNSVNQEGRVESVTLMDMGSLIDKIMKVKSPWGEALADAGFPDCKEEDLVPLVEYLEVCLKQVVQDNELGALISALEGRYIIPGPGGDPVRNPDVLPTGKNMHALDPQSIPTSAAISSAQTIVEKLLLRLKAENDGTYPESIAMVLWGTDNIKTYGESLAQVLAMVGVEPLPDNLGRVNKVRLIPLEELGRPRVDVVVNCSGVFRDLFINQMALIDRAVKMAAEADEPVEMNFVRKHALEQAEELGVTVREAAQRVFSNSSGSYSSNVSLTVENGGWEDEQQLQQMYLNRKSFAFNSDRPGVMEMQSDVFQSALKKCDATFQNLDSSEISLTDVSHYFDSDPTNLVQSLRDDGKKPLSYIADTTTANGQVRSLSETVRLDTRTKLLNPKWYEGMLSSGYEGAREISKRLRNTMGWSATSGQVDNWVYEDANTTFMADPEMQKRLLEMNPNSFRSMVTTLLEANGRGYWETTEENLDRLRELYQEVEDRIEGVE